MLTPHNPLSRIVERVPPPHAAVDGTGDWTEAESQLGIRLPEDYKTLVETYGRGDFCGALCLCTPFGEENPVPLTADLLEDYGYLREQWPELYPYPLFPEPGGLITWAVTGAGAQLCWRTEGPPESWPVVLWSRDDDYEEYECGAAAFLEAWLGGRIASEILLDDPDLAPWFDPAVEHDQVYVRLAEIDWRDVEEGRATPYVERLRILRQALGTTADRGSFEHVGNRQDHFVVVETGWQLTYETAYGHQIRVAFPPDDSEAAREAVLGAVESMGCTVLGVDTVRGTSSWKSLQP